MQLHVLRISDISIPANRQRREFAPEAIIELAESIRDNGLIHPPVVRKEGTQWVLVAGERRLRALEHLWMIGGELRMGESTFAESTVPCTYLGELDPLQAFEIELEENIRRTDLTWQEKATATSQLYELRRLQAEKRGELPPTTSDLTRELNPNTTSERGFSGSAHDAVREDLIVARHLSDPDVVRAGSRKDAIKILKRKEELQRNIALGAALGATFTSAVHDLYHGDSLKLMEALPTEGFDVILTDPPYGMDAQAFGDSGGMAAGAHFYDDSPDNWLALMRGFAGQSYRLAKAEAHAYVFCDIDRFIILRSMLSDAGWTCFRTPLIWVNPSAMRAPWPEHGPQRKYQLCLYAMKGKRNVTSLRPDVITQTLDENVGHPAQKPVDLYLDLLRRSVRPGDTVLDPFCGSGTIFPAAHAVKCKAVGIELDQAAYAIAAKRLADLGQEPLW